MKTILDSTIRAELINRIQKVNETSTAQWGKMNVYQMLKHCTLWEEMMQGKRQVKRVWLGYLFGKMSLKSMISDERPLRRNISTLTILKIAAPPGDIKAERSKWIALIERYEYFSKPYALHPFFGKITRAQLGQLAYKHTDHHLRQFNA